jgi:hypothetical protein
MQYSWTPDLATKWFKVLPWPTAHAKFGQYNKEFKRQECYQTWTLKLRTTFVRTEQSHTPCLAAELQSMLYSKRCFRARAQ